MDTYGDGCSGSSGGYTPLRREDNSETYPTVETEKITPKEAKGLEKRVVDEEEENPGRSNHKKEEKEDDGINYAVISSIILLCNPPTM